MIELLQPIGAIILCLISGIILMWIRRKAFPGWTKEERDDEWMEK